jgi:Ser/Thr protein kinase RdoA (MazF antagonist)
MPDRSPLARLLRRYGIVAPHSFRPLVVGLLNRSYRVETSQGRYFLKHYLEPEPANIAFQHRATTALRRAGLPVVAPIADRAGRTVNRAHGHTFALYPWIDGYHRHGLELTRAECEELGRLLGDLHATLARLLPPAQQTLVGQTVAPEAALAELDRLLALVDARGTGDAFDQLARFRLHERRQMLHDLAPLRPDEWRLPLLGWVHGDFHEYNVIYRRDQACVVVDWDRLAVKPYVDEVVRASVLLFIDAEDGWLDLERINAFADGYRSRMPEVAAQYPLGVHRVWWERLTDFWMLSWRYERGDPRSDTQFPAAAALVVWWTEAYQKVVESFG